MPRYIDADKFVDIINSLNIVQGSLSAVYITDVIHVLYTVPTTDVQEVRHGKWVERVKIRKDEEVRLVHWQCSLCECFLGTNTANYCPNCGARMDGDEK